MELRRDSPYSAENFEVLLSHPSSASSHKWEEDLKRFDVGRSAGHVGG